MSRPVVTRIAPSPTGSMHIGTARTALFNHLYARRHGGKFLIRVEDTDRERSTQENVDILFQGFAWLGLASDEEPVYQARRADRHRQVVDELVERGAAFRCWMTPEETEAARDQARSEGRALRSSWRSRTDGDLSQPHVIRFRTPDDEPIVIADAVQGAVTFPSKDLDDLVLLRSSGEPTYNLAVVVDDHDMGISHVIRGDDHLNNTPRQALIYDAMGWERPVFAHVPLIHGPDGKKLSKRHGATSVAEYADQGYLPEAMRNYLARLGWSHGDDELFSDAQAESWFDLEHIGRAPARLDFDKLNHVNGWWIRQADDERLAALVQKVRSHRGEATSDTDLPRLIQAIPMIKDRADTLISLADQAAFALLNRPVVIAEKPAAQLTDEARARLSRLAGRLHGIEAWDAALLDAELKAFAESEAVGMGKIGPPLRAALTGGVASPDIAKTLAALGKAESLGRLSDILSPSA
jgi:glutamyl-tRNA synthetase